MEQDLKDLALAAVNRTAVLDYSQADVEGALRAELKKIASTPQEFEKNKWTIFELIQETADAIIPNRIMEIMSQFAEVKQVGQGNKATFKRKLGKRRGKSFVTTVAPAGTYEAFRLDSETFEVPTSAVGASAIVDWERYLDGLDDLSDLIDIIMEGIEDAIYKAVYEQLIASYLDVKMPDANKVTSSTFDKAAMDKLISVVKSYGDSAVIFCTPLFAATIDNEIKQSYLPDGDKNDIREQGFVGVYHGTPVVVLPMATETEENKKWAYDPSYAFVMPAGKEKVVKVVLEGDLQMNSWTNADWSMEIAFYKKFGTAMLYFNNWGIYKNTSLSQEV
jgi:hypothetical protein